MSLTKLDGMVMKSILTMDQAFSEKRIMQPDIQWS